MATAPARPSRWKALRFKLFVNTYFPYLGAGIRLTHVAPDFSALEVRMRLHRWNQNYVGTHFGGSLFSMADPFYMVMLIELLGPGYVVWDKSASIRFRRPGRGTVRARFEIPTERLEEIRRGVDAAGKVETSFSVSIRDEQGEVVAEVEKLIHVRRKAAPA
jgi:acyl-coenzyme A thioesterase PaaI-like protein